jgi:hypothetical protein
MQKLHPSKVLITGTVRNCGDTLQSEFRRVSNALSSEIEIYWYLVGSDSEDSTIEVLELLKKSVSKFEYTSLGRLSLEYPVRTERIAFCRNVYLKEVRRRFKDVEFVIVMDFDGINSKISNAAINSCWGENFWDVVAANQDGAYFDIWALRHSLWNPNDWIDEFKFYKSNGLSDSKSLQKNLYSKMITIPKDSDWIPVDSAFGGFAIYRRSIMNFGEYRGSLHDGEEVCEHVAFHKDLKAAGARIYINPTLINAGLTSHTQILRHSVRIKTFLRRKLRI